jgi:hypothetical protein
VSSEEKQEKYSEVGQKVGWKSRPLPLFWPAPILHPSNSGAKLKKDIRIQSVKNSIMFFHQSLITRQSSLSTTVKMLQ